MAFSLCQYLAERYYKRRNYIVERNIPILPKEEKKQFWSDLDLLAVGEDVLLVNCKDFLPSSKQREKIVENLDDAEKYLKDNYKFLSGKKFKKQYVFIGTDKETRDYLRKQNIEILCFDDLFVRYLRELDDFLNRINKKYKDKIKTGMRYYRIGNFEDLDKFLAYLLNNSLLNEERINQKLKKLELHSLSKVREKK